jgi:PAS domain S-box-containing protein
MEKPSYEHLEQRVKELEEILAGVEKNGKALRESEEKYRILFEQAHDSIFIFDPEARLILECNENAARRLGYTRDQLLGMTVDDIAAPMAVERMNKIIKELKEKGSVVFEHIHLHKSGKEIPVEISSRMISYGDKKVFQSFVRDITKLKKAREVLEIDVRERTAELAAANQELNREINERKQVEEALKQSEERFRAIADYTYDWENWIDPEGKLTWTNPAVERITGYTLEEYLNHPDRIGLVVVEEDRERVRDLIEKGLKQRISGNDIPFRILRKDGTIRWVAESFQPIYGADGRHLGLRTSIRDISERKKAEIELQEREEQYKRLVKGIPGMFYLFSDKRGGIFYSQSVESVLGYPISHLYENPQLWNLSIHPDDQEKVNKAIGNFSAGEDFELEYRIKDASGNWHWFYDRSIGRRIVENEVIIEGLALDTTDRKKAEQEQEELLNQLRELQRLDALGTLAGGIAHDFNNILAAIIGYTELASYKLPPGNPALADLDEVLRAANRAKDLTGRILAFSRQGSQERRPLQIHPVIKEVLKLLRATIPTTIRICENIASDCGMVLADPTQIHQVMMNLGTNAYHAMRDRCGILEVSLESVEIADNVNQGLKMEPGKYIKLEVSDTGHGMSHAVLERIFDPYFTTKKKGEGTGLGLAVVHGIVKSHNGCITVSSEPGVGTTFRIYLPCIDAYEDATAAAAGEPMPEGQEHILFVDDEEVLVHLGRKVLKRLGYSVTALTCSKEALQTFQTQPEIFDLVITDMNMPQMTGAQLACELMKIRPGIPIILVTGFSELIDKKTAKELGFRGYVMKPILMRELAAVIRKVLTEKAND